MKVRYGIVIEKGDKNYSAYVPDLPGCISTGKSLTQVRKRIGEAIAFHLEGMALAGLLIPEPSSLCEEVEVG
jgi:predicted RNase H-like HicB family nuclease